MVYSYRNSKGVLMVLEVVNAIIVTVTVLVILDLSVFIVMYLTIEDQPHYIEYIDQRVNMVKKWLKQFLKH